MEQRKKEKWNSKIDTKNKVLETEIDGEKKNFRMINIGGNHVGIEIENAKLKEEEILYAKVKKIHLKR